MYRTISNAYIEIKNKKTKPDCLHYSVLNNYNEGPFVPSNPRIDAFLLSTNYSTIPFKGKYIEPGFIHPNVLFIEK